MDLTKYISIGQRQTNGGTTTCYEVWFDQKTAYADGAIKIKPLSDRTACHFEQQPDGTFICDDDNFTTFQSREAAERFSIAGMIAFQSAR